MPSQWAGSGQEALSEDREWLGGPFGGLGVVGTSSQMAGSGWEALPEGREWSEVVRKPSWTSSSGRVSLLEDGSDQEALTEVRETFPEGREWSEGHPVGPEVVGRPT